jgi:hypothetical protein
VTGAHGVVRLESITAGLAVQLPLALLGAGLSILPGLAGQVRSCAERLFSFLDIGALSEDDSAKALRDPAHAAG